MSEQAVITPRAVELMQELVAEIAEAAERKRLEQQRPITVQDLAERTGQTLDAIYAQIKRRAENGLESSGALLKPPGQRRGWRINPEAYEAWLSWGSS